MEKEVKVNYCRVFRREGKCKYGDKCRYSHDLNGMAELPSERKYCFGFFGCDKKCKDGDQCKYSHDVDTYLSEKGLKYCPSDCGNFCRSGSRMCSTCVTEWLEEKKHNDEEREKKHNEWLVRKEEREKRKAEFNERPEKQCSGYNCQNMTKFRFCKDCYEANCQYVVSSGNFSQSHYDE
jgi:hypothetical protein